MLDRIDSGSETETVIGHHRLITADCRDALPRLADRSVDVVVTSPPYNIGIAYGTHDDRMDRQAYVRWFTEIATELRRILKDDGSFFLNISGTNADPWGPFEIVMALRDLFVLQNHIVWVKSIAIGEETRGHFKPINSRRYLNHTHEHVFHLTKAGTTPLDRLAVGVPFADKSNIARRGHAQDRRCAGNTWFIPYKTIQRKAEKFDHPASFPVDLPERCIRLHGVDGATVLDPFLGTGSTLVACERTGATGIGIEIDPDYAGRAADRLRAEA